MRKDKTNFDYIIEATIEYLNKLNEKGSKPPHEKKEIYLDWASKNSLGIGHNGELIKHYINQERCNTERGNTLALMEINNVRSEQIREEYLPVRMLHYENNNINTIESSTLVFRAVQGDTLYQMMINPKSPENIAKYILQASTLLARVQVELKNKKDRLNLVDVLATEEVKGSYYLERFRNNALDELSEYGSIEIGDKQKGQVLTAWSELVLPMLISRKMPRVYYWDGKPDHFIITKERKIICIDFEDRVITAPMGFANLVSYGLTKNGEPYFNIEEIVKILDNVLLQSAISIALINNNNQLAKDMLELGKDTEKNEYALAETKDFYKHIAPGKGRGDFEKGRTYRNNIINLLPFLIFQRNAELIGHKAWYIFETERKVNNSYISQDEADKRIKQLQSEQREHIRYNLDILQKSLNACGESLYFKTGIRSSLIVLQNFYNMLNENSYFKV